MVSFPYTGMSDELLAERSRGLSECNSSEDHQLDGGQMQELSPCDEQMARRQYAADGPQSAH